MCQAFSQGTKNRFDAFMDLCADLHTAPAGSISEIRARDDKKSHGDLFEAFCVLFLRRKYPDVWLLKNVPSEILASLGMQRRDFGIDIIARDENGCFHAIQCKYRNRTKGGPMSLSWRTLSTFFALCMRTGPWKSHVVMTTCDNTSRQGRRTEKDVSMCIGTFRKITDDEWIDMCGMVGRTLGDTIGNVVESDLTGAPGSTVDLNELREKRLKALNLNE